MGENMVGEGRELDECLISTLKYQKPKNFLIQTLDCSRMYRWFPPLARTSLTMNKTIQQIEDELRLFNLIYYVIYQMP